MSAVPFVNLIAQHRGLRDEIAAALDRLVSSASFIGGEAVAAFEAACAARLGVSTTCGVANGTDALQLCLRALGIGPGDEVIVPALTFFATAEAVALVGAEPVFCDVDEDTLVVGPDQVAPRLSARTRAIMTVDLYGRLAPVRAIRELVADRGIHVIEDAAQSFGAHAAARGDARVADAVTFSFYPTKNLGACGDAGLVACADPGLLDHVRSLANHGRQAHYLHGAVGTNSRLDAFQAAILALKLPYLDTWTRRRRQLALRYWRHLQGLETLVPVSADVLRAYAGGAAAEVAEHVWHLFVIRVTRGRRDELAHALGSRGIGTAVAYPVPLPHLDAFKHQGYQRGDFPAAELAAEQVLSLPLYPELADAQVDFVAESCGQILRSS
ncbi:MAG: DegT/DnrJ/EryC1/StrS family aminotransferase [Candidatus Schekmanbacteria bacterium]|nr:DegT/DnrJ/EryC1/StrS family aminotransferase [Candidatus Schekmanbacteria bacterium]